MKFSEKTVGLGIAGVAVLMLATAAIADNMGDMPMGDGMGGAGMMAPPELNFDTVDANKDGKISKDEIAAFRAGRAASIDTNGDGKLSVDEIAAMHLKMMTDAAQKMAQKMVDQLDTDGDHLLSAAEMLDRPMPANLFDRVDTNKDGFIDQAEAGAAKQHMMDRMGQRGGRHHGNHSMGDSPDGQGGADQNGN